MGELVVLPLQDPVVPLAVKVLHREFTVEFDNLHLDNAEADGLTSGQQSRIILRDDIQSDLQREVILHEVLHAIFYATGVELTQVDMDHVEERAVATLAGGLVSVLRENPDLVAFLLG